MCTNANSIKINVHGLRSVIAAGDVKFSPLCDAKAL